VSAPEVREVMGVRKEDGSWQVRAHEGAETIRIVVTADAQLTPNEARSFAASLYRLARRVEKRNAK